MVITLCIKRIRTRQIHHLYAWRSLLSNFIELPYKSDLRFHNMDPVPHSFDGSQTFGVRKGCEYQ